MCILWQKLTSSLRWVYIFNRKMLDHLHKWEYNVQKIPSIIPGKVCENMYLDHRITLKIARVLDMVDLSAMLMDANGNLILEKESSSSVAMKESICLALMVVPAVLLLVGAVVLLVGFRLPKSKLEQMQQEIEARKAQEEVQA